MSTQRILRSSIIAFSLAALFGCSNTTTPPPAEPTGPGVGSTFTVAHWADQTNQADTITYQIANADTAWRGRAHAIKFIQVVAQGLPQPNPTFVAIESSGDVSVWPKPSTSQADWFTIPYVTQAHGTTNWDPDGATDSTKTISDGDSPSTGSLLVNGTSYPTQRAKVTILLDQDTTVHHYAWSPDLHFRVSDDQDASTDGFQSAQHWKLVSFVKK